MSFDLANPLPLPDYQFDPALSEDDNFLIWCGILTRLSTSRKGHMGSIFVRPPEKGDPSVTPPENATNGGSEAASTSAKPFEAPWPEPKSRVLMHANNTPLIYNSLAKAVPEVHAEALAISRSARRGIPLEGCTVYVTFPPCNECFKLLVSAGVRRCVYRKSCGPVSNEGVYISAEVAGMSLEGTLDSMFAPIFKGKERVPYLGLPGKEHLVPGEDWELEDDDTRTAFSEAQREKEREKDLERDSKIRDYWAGVGEDGPKTRARVDDWWREWMATHRAAKRVIRKRWGIVHRRKGGGAAGKEGVEALEEEDSEDEDDPLGEKGGKDKKRKQQPRVDNPQPQHLSKKQRRAKEKEQIQKAKQARQAEAQAAAAATEDVEENAAVVEDEVDLDAVMNGGA